MKIWQTKKLGEICDVFNGVSIPKNQMESKGKFKFLKNRDYSESKIFWNNDEFGWTNNEVSKNKLLKIGDNILINAAHNKSHVAGKIGYVDELKYKYVVSSAEVMVVRAKEGIVLPEMIKFILKTTNAIEQIKNKINGIHLYPKDVSQVAVSLPESLPEQRRIVKILNDIFEKINKAKENTEKNLQNSKELFESYLQNIFDNPDKDWKRDNLGNLTLKIGSGATPRGGKKSYKAQGISLIRSMNVHDRNFKIKNLAFIDEKQAGELSNVILEKDDVLLNITGASVARCCIIPGEYLPARVNQHVSIIRPKREIIDYKFLHYLLTSKPYKNRLLNIGEQGATRQAITKAQLGAFAIHFPNSTDEQKAIVKKMDVLSTETKKLEAIYKQKIANLEELKKSVLKKAFAGEL